MIEVESKSGVLLTLESALSLTAHDSKLVDRFMDIYKIPEDVCFEILRVTKIFLWLSIERDFRENKSIPMFKINFVVDEMWHNFILFSMEYTEFSNLIYGKYIHHAPSMDGAIFDLDEYEATIRFIAKYVDEKTLENWFIIWPEIYSEKLLKTTMLVIS
jgi:hypothetical protein